MDTTKLLTLLLVLVQSMVTEGAKTTRPVHEVINEPVRPDLEKPRQIYVNPLAGNQQRARQHALNQQAMFNAERDRQHRAQLQRWSVKPPKMDSYMQAYHESHENHHVALETQQTKLKSKNQGQRSIKNEPIKQKQDKSRNHRSYGSDYYAHIVKTNRPKYYEGVTIKPNGNNGLTEAESTSLYTEAIPSTQYVYPKQYSQMQGYHSAHDIASLSSLLMKPANDQLSELNALIQSSKIPEENDIHKPIDLFFYLKDTPQSQNDENRYEIPQYAQAYAEHTEVPQDLKPIREEINDISDPNQGNIIQYGLQPTTNQFAEKPETSTTKSNNYYKVEVASQTISGGYKQELKPQFEYVLQQESNEDDQGARPDYQETQYAQRPSYYEEKDNANEQRYLHHNGEIKGIQHLTGDGTGVSAYGESTENLQYAANYEFGYRVRDEHSGNYFGHHEAKSGEKTSGHYHVLLPDGRMQKVKYYAGPSGFHADISYDHLEQ